MANKRQKKKQAKAKLMKFKGKKVSKVAVKKLGSSLTKTIKAINKIKKGKAPKRKRKLYKVKKSTPSIKPTTKVEEIVTKAQEKKNYYVSGQFDTFILGGEMISNNGIKSALNRLIDAHPELAQLIEEFREAGGNMATLEYLFTEYYFDAREDVYIDYSANPYEIYEDGYQGFIGALKEKISILREEEEAYNAL